jgi:hypothetical protein
MEFLLYELVQNAWDEDVTRVDVTFTWDDGIAKVLCVDDSPEGFRDMASAYTLYRESYKKGDTSKRGRFEAGEKFVLACAEEAVIVSTKGTVKFLADGTRKETRTKTEKGTRFEATFKMLKRDYDQICAAVTKLIPPVPTFFNGEPLATRKPMGSFEHQLPTVIAAPDGTLLPSARKTEVRIYVPKQGETPMLYEMGIPVVETEDKWHVDVQQKVPLNIERDGVNPAYLRRIRVAVLNNMHEWITQEDSTSTWVKEAASDPYCSNEAITKVLDERYGKNRVAYDPNDVGANREAASKEFVVIAGGAMSGGEWKNARRAEAIPPAGQLFPTNLKGKVADKEYDPSEYDDVMKYYARLVEKISPLLTAPTTVKFIKDARMVAGCYNHVQKVVTVNLAHISLMQGRPSQQFLDLLIHELAHDTVRSNDHLNHQFYGACCELGAKLTRLALLQPELFKPETK